MLTHDPVLKKEIIEVLSLSPSDVVVDATFGRGGHTRALLDCLGPEGRLIAIDRDPEAIRCGQEMIKDLRVTWVHRRFSELAQILSELGIGTCNALLFDFGVSSPQLDDPQRGFSFQREGPLDMRMNPEDEDTAFTWLHTASEEEIADVFFHYGEERQARRLARGIVARRREAPFETTMALSQWIARQVPAHAQRIHPATRVFQAMRIHVNQELREIEMALPQILSCVASEGRVALMSFHSLEDRLVKHFLQSEAYPERAYPEGIPLRKDEFPEPRLKIMSSLIRPSEAEMAQNPRARSARLRVAMRL